jgi:hypothetical protein
VASAVAPVVAVASGAVVAWGAVVAPVAVVAWGAVVTSTPVVGAVVSVADEAQAVSTIPRMTKIEIKLKNLFIFLSLFPCVCKCKVFYYL